MNKKIIKAVLAIAIVFCFAAVPMYGIVGMVKGDESAVGIVRNVAPTVNVAMTGHKNIVYNSGSDTITFNAAVIDRNREDDIGNVGDTPSGCWWNISSATTGNYVNYTVIIATSPGADQVNLYNATANDGILAISDNNAGAGYVWTCPATWAVGTYYSNLTITDSAGHKLDFTPFSFEVRSAVKIIGVYNYTGLLVDSDSPFYWNFTTTDPTVLNVTSGNWSYTGTTDPATNYGYDNATGRLYSFWLVVNNTGGVVGQCFNVSFAGGFTNTTYPGTPITTSDVIYFESYKTSNITWANNATACTNSNASWVTANEASKLNYTKDGAAKYGIWGDGSANAKVMFQFDEVSQNIWIRFMIDIPAMCMAATYVCPYSMTAG